MPWKKDKDTVNVLAIDPGGTTGLAYVQFLVEYDDDVRVCMGTSSFRSWEDEPWFAMNEVETMLRRPHPEHKLDAVVVERYVITPATLKKTAQYEALYQVGVLLFFGWNHDVPVVLQQPSVTKKLVPDASLKSLNWYRPSKGGHQNDAARHLAAYGLQHGLILPTVHI